MPGFEVGFSRCANTTFRGSSTVSTDQSSVIEALGGVVLDNDDNDTQRSPSNSRWRPGLTSVSVGVMTPRERVCQSRCGLRCWQGLHLHTVIKCAVHRISMRNAHDRRNTGCSWIKFSESIQWNPRILSNTSKETWEPGGKEEPEKQRDTRGRVWQVP